AIGTSPTINVYAADGQGTLTSNVANVANGSTGNSITFTYTATAGGISSGEVDIAVPTGNGCTTPRITAGAGCVSSASGSVAVSGSTIQWSGLTLAANGTATITYGATSGGSCTAGNGAAAGTTAGT